MATDFCEKFEKLVQFDTVFNGGNSPQGQDQITEMHQKRQEISQQTYIEKDVMLDLQVKGLIWLYHLFGLVHWVCWFIA